MEILRELKKWGFNINLVLNDSLYEKSGNFIEVSSQLKLQNRIAYIQTGTFHQQSVIRFIREISFGQRYFIRYYQRAQKFRF